MGMASSAWQHTIVKHAVTIRDQTISPAPQLARPEGPAPEALVDKLMMIERLSTRY
jgi:hypothetical protein